MNNVAKSIKEELERTLDKGTCTVWVNPLSIELTDKKLSLFAPNAFVAKWVEERLFYAIQNAAQKILGFLPEIEIGVSSSVSSEQNLSISAMSENSTLSQVNLLAQTTLQTNSNTHTHSNTQINFQTSSNTHTRSFPYTPVKSHASSFAVAEKDFNLTNGSDPVMRHAGLPSVGTTPLRLLNNWQFAFEDFIIGNSNELACAASRSLCTTNTFTDCLFLHSSPGLGKTHLLHSIGKTMSMEANKDVNIACLTAEEFFSRYVLSLRSGEIDRFKSQFREGIDVLLLEDIHFFQGKEKAQEELLSTLKALKTRGCKVVLTSPFKPHELKNIDEQLVSRFCSGFLAHIDRPDMDVRCRIIEHKARKMSIQVPREVSFLLAEHITSDIRQLESCLKNMILKAQLLNRNISLELAMEVLDQYSTTNIPPDYEKIIAFVCKSYALSEKELRSKSRKKSLVIARNMAFYLARQHTDLSLQDIGGKLGREHSTVIKGIANIESELRRQSSFGRQLQNTVDRLGVH